MTKWRTWLGIAISAIAVYLVARRVDWPSFAAAIRGVSPAWLIAGAAAMVASFVMAGLRWRQVIAGEVALTRRDAFDIVMIANLTNLVAPSRAGDLARAVLVARRGNAPVGRVLGAIVVERYADVAIVLILAAGLSMFVQFPASVRVGMIAFTAVAVASVVALFVVSDRLPGLVTRLGGLIWPSMAARLASLFENILSGMRRAGGLRTFGATLVLSALSWTLSAAAFMCYLRAFRLPVPWYAAFFVLLVINLGGVIPTSPGSIGVYHYLTVLALSVWAVKASAALGYAVAAHALGLAVVTLVGLVSLASQHQTLFGVERMVEQEGSTL